METIMTATAGVSSRSGEGASRSRAAVAALYLSAFLVGLSLVSFPASSVILKERLGFTDRQYGSIFLPQLAVTVVAALCGGGLARKVGLKRLLSLSMAASSLSAFALAAAASVASMAYPLVMAGTGLLGLAFGLSAAPLNTYPGLLFPGRQDVALVGAHSCLGIGLAVGPAVGGLLLMHGAWIAFPIGIACLAFALAAFSALVRFPAAAASRTGPAGAPSPVREAVFWVFVAAAVLYAFCEGVFQNWGILLLQEEKHIAPEVAALALSAFWGAITAGRILSTILLLRVRPFTLWRVLPVIILACFLLLPNVQGPSAGIALFAIAGLGCSSFFPITVGLAARRFPDYAPWVSSVMVAALMAGSGGCTFIYGALRSGFSLESLYLFSAAYPLAVIVLAALLRKPIMGQT